jgi:hypothetical protein
MFHRLYPRDQVGGKTTKPATPEKKKNTFLQVGEFTDGLLEE